MLESSIRVHDDTSMVLASYALQAELGDYDKIVHGFDYFIPQHYLPAKVRQCLCRYVGRQYFIRLH